MGSCHIHRAQAPAEPQAKKNHPPHCTQVEEPIYFVDFLREPVADEETGETVDAHPSFYEAVPGGLPEIRKRVEALQRRFNEDSKASAVRGRLGCVHELLQHACACVCVCVCAAQPAQLMHITTPP